MTESLNSTQIDPNLKEELPGFWHSVLIIVAALVLSLAVGGLMLVLPKVIPAISPWVIFLNYTLTFIPLVYFAKYIFNVKVFDTQKTSILVYAALIPATIAMAVVSESLASIIPVSEKFIKLLEKMIQIDGIGYLTIAVAAPILEELIFRGVLLKGFLRKYSETKAILLSALIFGAFHLNPWQFIPAFLIGTAIGWIYVKTRSIWPAIFIHWLNNSLGFYFVYKFADVNTGYPDLMGSKAQYIGLLIASIFTCIFIFYFLNNYFNKQQKIGTQL